MGFSLFKKKEVQEVVKLDKNLYILAEVQKPGLVNYMEANDMHVKAISSDINRLLMGLIREKNPIRLVIIDYGIGKFKTLEAINNIIGLISTAQGRLGEDEKHNTTVFTRNGSLLKAIKESGIVVDVRDYKGASDIVKALLEYPETYITAGAKDVEGAPSADLQAYKYEWKDKDTLNKKIKTSKPTIDITNVDPTVGDDMMESFQCRF